MRGIMGVLLDVLSWSRTSRLKVRLTLAYSRARFRGHSWPPIRGTSAPRLLCPSYPPNGHHHVLGIVNELTGRFTFVSSIHTQSVATNELPEKWETRFRNFGSCVKTSCGHWNQGSCRLGRAVAKLKDVLPDDVGECPIQRSCRWRAEQGEIVCRACPSVRYVDFKNIRR